ncbi:cytochrome P450 [Mycena epipterygia]|nr:cytochrome P450 [Mycena epipterygia]
MQDFHYLFFSGLVLLLLYILALKGVWVNLRHAKLPPGPTRRILGDNRADVPISYFWKTFRSWHTKYGPVVSLYLGRTPVIVLGTAEAAHDLLEKRGDIYSGRPRNIVSFSSHEILSGGMRGIGMSYGPRYRRWKSLIQAGLSRTAVLNYRPLQFVISVIFCVAYGRRIATLYDSVVVQNKKTDEYFVKYVRVLHYPLAEDHSHATESTLLTMVPLDAERHQKLDAQLYMSFMNDVKRQLLENIAQPSMAAYSLSKQAEFGLTDVETAYALSAPWAAGVGTTVASIDVFLLQKKAFEDIDSVVGQTRSPGFEDYNNLPYIQALIREVTRWRCIVPTGFPHATSANDVYQGMFIPKGATVYANIYAMTTDPEIFPDPDEFRPERFLDTSDPQLLNYTIPFGFGRRLCPGQNVALQTMFIFIVRVLWAFQILPGLDEAGNVVAPSADDFTSGLITRPTPFPCRFEPRQNSTVEVVHIEAERADVESVVWELK